MYYVKQWYSYQSTDENPANSPSFKTIRECLKFVAKKQKEIKEEISSFYKISTIIIGIDKRWSEGDLYLFTQDKIIRYHYPIEEKIQETLKKISKRTKQKELFAEWSFNDKCYVIREEK